MGDSPILLPRTTQYDINGVNKIGVKDTRNEVTEGVILAHGALLFSLQKRILLLPYVSNTNTRLFITRVVKLTSVHRFNCVCIMC